MKKLLFSLWSLFSRSSKNFLIKNLSVRNTNVIYVVFVLNVYCVYFLFLFLVYNLYYKSYSYSSFFCPKLTRQPIGLDFSELTTGLEGVMPFLKSFKISGKRFYTCGHCELEMYHFYFCSHFVSKKIFFALFCP